LWIKKSLKIRFWRKYRYRGKRNEIMRLFLNFSEIFWYKNVCLEERSGQTGGVGVGLQIYRNEKVWPRMTMRREKSG
jgi:hypothetical protein